MREYKFIKLQQQGLAVPDSDSMKPAKTLIPDKYNTWMELKKTNRIKYSTKALLELRYQGFIKEEVRSCANISSALDKLIV